MFLRVYVVFVSVNWKLNAKFPVAVYKLQSNSFFFLVLVDQTIMN